MSADKTIPEMSSYEEIAEFWDTHSLADYWERTEAADFEIDPVVCKNSIPEHYSPKTINILKNEN